MPSIADTPASRAFARKTRLVVARRRVNAYTDHIEECPICTKDKHCETGYALAEAMAEYIEPVGGKR
jgi:hypothetical protein